MRYFIDQKKKKEKNKSYFLLIILAYQKLVIKFLVRQHLKVNLHSRLTENICILAQFKIILNLFKI